jgi:hypothetical protein
MVEDAAHLALICFTAIRCSAPRMSSSSCCGRSLDFGFWSERGIVRLSTIFVCGARDRSAVETGRWARSAICAEEGGRRDHRGRWMGAKRASGALFMGDFASVSSQGRAKVAGRIGMMSQAREASRKGQCPEWRCSLLLLTPGSLRRAAVRSWPDLQCPSVIRLCFDGHWTAMAS